MMIINILYIINNDVDVHGVRGQTYIFNFQLSIELAFVFSQPIFAKGNS